MWAHAPAGSRPARPPTRGGCATLPRLVAPERCRTFSSAQVGGWRTEKRRHGTGATCRGRVVLSNAPKGAVWIPHGRGGTPWKPFAGGCLELLMGNAPGGGFGTPMHRGDSHERGRSGRRLPAERATVGELVVLKRQLEDAGGGGRPEPAARYVLKSQGVSWMEHVRVRCGVHVICVCVCCSAKNMRRFSARQL